MKENIINDKDTTEIVIYNEKTKELIACIGNDNTVILADNVAVSFNYSSKKKIIKDINGVLYLNEEV